MNILGWTALAVLGVYALLRGRRKELPRDEGHRLSLVEFLLYDKGVTRALAEWMAWTSIIQVMGVRHETLKELERARNEKTRLVELLADAVGRWEAEQYPMLRGWRIFWERETVTGVLWAWNDHCKGFQIGFIWWRFCLHYWSEP